MKAAQQLCGVALLCGALLVAGAPAPTSAGPGVSRMSANRGHLYVERGNNIYVVNADGSGVRQVTRTGTAKHPDIQPAVSPDGGQLAYVVAGEGAILAMPATGGPARVVAVQAVAQNPVWSPDGRYIAYDWYEGCSYVYQLSIYYDELNEIGVNEVATGRQIGGSACGDQYINPTWAPDRPSTIVTSRLLNGNNLDAGTAFSLTTIDFRMHAADLNPAGERALTHDETHSYLNPAFSPGGRYIACVRTPVRGANDPSRDGVLWVMNSDGSGGHKVAPVVDLARPAWSPDGTTIAFSHAHAVYTVPAAGGAPSLLIANAQDPAWGGRSSAPPPPVATPAPATPGPSVTLTLPVAALFHEVNGTVQPTTTLQMGEKALFLVLYRTVPAQAGTPSGTLTILKGGRLIETDTMQAESAANGTRALFALTRFNDSALVGPLTARFTLQLGGASATRSLEFALQPAS